MRVTTSNGFLSVNPASTPTETSDLNWTAGETASNLVITTNTGAQQRYQLLTEHSS